MTRPHPQLTPAQLKSIAAHSRGQILNEARQRELDASLTSLERSFVESEARMKQLRKTNAWWDRYGHWFARAALVPVVVLAVGLIAMVATGLWSGEINVISRSSKAMSGRIDSPVAYWLAVVHHSLMAAFVTYVATVVFQLSRSRMEPEISASDTVELLEVTAQSSDPQPVVGSSGMSLHTFDADARHGKADHSAATASTSNSQVSS